VGFALVRPTSTIEQAIAADPTSPVAVAHEMARRNGAVPGRSMILRLIPIVPAALMALADSARRWQRGAALFGVALVATSGLVLARVPALSHARPSSADALLALLAALACALASGWCAIRLAETFGRAASDIAARLARLDPLPRRASA
jgi:hypothetical protein